MRVWFQPMVTDRLLLKRSMNLFSGKRTETMRGDKKIGKRLLANSPEKMQPHIKVCIRFENDEKGGSRYDVE